MIDEQNILEQTIRAILELAEAAKLQPGAQVVVGCSTSEIMGGRIGHASAPEVGNGWPRLFWTCAKSAASSPFSSAASI